MRKKTWGVGNLRLGQRPVFSPGARVPSGWEGTTAGARSVGFLFVQGGRSILIFRYLLPQLGRAGRLVFGFYVRNWASLELLV